MIRRVLSVTLAMMTVGCNRPEVDMGKQPKAKALDGSEFFADGASARPLPVNTVARAASEVPGGPYELAAKNTLPTTRPVITRAVLEHGQEQFDIFCAACHGRLGNGEGIAVQRGLTPPPSFHVPRLRAIGDDHFYDVITNGYGAMLSYNDRIPPARRWEIVAYIRALQLAPDVVSASNETRTELTARGDHPQSVAGGRQ